jgi:chromosome segregation ATPase
VTALGKTFVVFVTVVSLIFLGFAAITTIAGPNFQAEHVKAMPDYIFESAPGEEVTWAVKNRRRMGDKQAGETIKTGAKSLAEVVLAARRFHSTYQKNYLDELTQTKASLSQQLEDAKRFITKDLEALQRREEELNQETERLRQQLKMVSDDYIAKAQQAQSISRDAAKRREDVARLTNQLAELRTDHYRVVEQQRKLRNVLVQLEGRVVRGEQRRESLQATLDGKTPGGSPANYDESVSAAPASE